VKTVSGAYQTFIGGDDHPVAVCLKATRTDGEVFGFCSHDRALEVDGVTYVPGLRPSASQSKAGLEATNAETEGGFGSDAVTEADIAAGKWDYAAIEIFRVNWSDLTMGVEKIGSGHMGQVTRGRIQFTAELLGEMEVFNQQIGRVVEPACDADLGDSRCKVRLDPPAWQAGQPYTQRVAAEAGSGSVVKPSTPNDRHFKCTTAGTSGGSEPSWNTTIGGTTSDGSVTWTTIQALTVIGDLSHVTSRSVFRDSARTEAVNFFAGGTITITQAGSDNEGLQREVKSYAVDGTFTLQLPFPYDVAVSDDYEATAGCAFRFSEDCKTKFDNGNNFRGFPHVPGVDFLSSGKVGEAA
jgi:hypothetical protein